MSDSPNSVNERHRQRMQRKKEIVDAGIKRAQQERGVTVVHTGNGKGKSSAAFGMIARALGHGMHVAVVQFIKGADSTGEEVFFRRFPEVEFHVMGEGFTWETQNRERDIRAAQSAWEKAISYLENPAFDLVVLDELNIALRLGYLSLGNVLQTIQDRPSRQHVIITGRGAPAELIDISDTVTEMSEIKHAYKSGVQAQKGVEF